MKKLLSITVIGFIYSLLAFSAYAVIDIPRPVNIPEADIGKIISAIVGVALIVAAIAAFLFLILGGIQWITSGGDKAGMEAARNRITAAIVGLIIVAAAWAVMLLVGQFLGIELLGKGGLKIPTIESPTIGM